MPRIASVILVLFAALVPAASQAEVRVDAANPPESLAIVRESLAGQGPVTCRFTESRKFAFRRKATLLEGSSDYLPGKGLVLRYREPLERTIGILRNGIIGRDSTGQKTLRELPGQYENMLSLYDLDLASLSEDFVIFYDGSPDSWTIRLAERPGPVKAGRGHSVETGLVTMTIRGEGGTIHALEIVKPGTISIEIRMSDVRGMTAEETAKAAADLQP